MLDRKRKKKKKKHVMMSRGYTFYICEKSYYTLIRKYISISITELNAENREMKVTVTCELRTKKVFSTILLVLNQSFNY